LEGACHSASRGWVSDCWHGSALLWRPRGCGVSPSPSLSNREKASLNSAICSSVSESAPRGTRGAAKKKVGTGNRRSEAACASHSPSQRHPHRCTGLRRTATQPGTTGWRSLTGHGSDWIERVLEGFDDGLAWTEPDGVALRHAFARSSRRMAPLTPVDVVHGTSEHGLHPLGIAGLWLEGAQGTEERGRVCEAVHPRQKRECEWHTCVTKAPTDNSLRSQRQGDAQTPGSTPTRAPRRPL